MTALQDRPAGLPGLVPVCPYTDLQPERGVAALLPDGSQVAVFRLGDGSLHAVANLDPFSGAAVLSRGLVGDRDGAPVVISPLHKQSFDLTSGACMDDPEVTLRVYRIERVDDMVWVGPQ